ncbi:early nodulin-like protein 1 [Striga asiatica]|uniref:Early nodulin-like protein 1 n=1 Tax=Striga asiatica TaxID=4170 RepID=A0A5A7REF5_STRAF|nr:early nodulin-like protein 1 [Striga asiatica]
MNIGTITLLLLPSIGIAYGSHQHVVGDSIWSIPPTHDFYSNWSTSYSFHVGDTLYFDFDSGFYDVNLVLRGEFDSCSGAHAVRAFVEGPVFFRLSRKGAFYFVCGVSNYCSLGMKVSVVVDDRSESPSSSPVPSFGPGNPPVAGP